MGKLLTKPQIHVNRFVIPYGNSQPEGTREDWLELINAINANEDKLIHVRLAIEHVFGAAICIYSPTEATYEIEKVRLENREIASWVTLAYALLNEVHGPEMEGTNYTGIMPPDPPFTDEDVENALQPILERGNTDQIKKAIDTLTAKLPLEL